MGWLLLFNNLRRLLVFVIVIEIVTIKINMKLFTAIIKFIDLYVFLRRSFFLCTQFTFLVSFLLL